MKLRDDKQNAMSLNGLSTKPMLESKQQQFYFPDKKHVSMFI